jgi:hypothetical protein
MLSNLFSKLMRHWHTLNTVPRSICLILVHQLIYALISVAGKKGKVMERRIMKDFTIGIANEALAKKMADAAATATAGSKDIFGSLAKIVGKKSVKK